MVVGRVDSAAICSLAAHVPQRVVVGVGNKVMGGGAAPCNRAASYSGALGVLVMGEAAQKESGLAEMLYTHGFGALRLVDLPILVAARGPTSRNALPSSPTWRPPRSPPPTPNESRHGARIVVAAEDTCRRIERDPPDGARQRLVPLRLKVRWAVDHLAAGLDCLSYGLTNDKEGKP